MPYTFEKADKRKDFNRSGAYAAVYFIAHDPNGGNGPNAPVYAGMEVCNVPTENKLIGLLCVLQNMDDIPLSAINERELQGVGKNNIIINDGEQIDPFNITIDGNAVGTISALVGHDINHDPAFQVKRDYFVKGSLLIVSHDNDGTPRRSDLITSLKVRIPSLAGITAGGENPQTVTFYSENATCYIAIGTKSWAVEVWHKDDASIVNTNAPNGVLTTFTLGQGNGSTGTPQALSWNSANYAAGTSLYEYYALAQLNGQKILTGDISAYDETSITFGTAPADKAYLLLFYLIDLSLYDWPLYLNGDTETNPEAMNYVWDDHLTGDCASGS